VFIFHKIRNLSESNLQPVFVKIVSDFQTQFALNDIELMQNLDESLAMTVSDSEKNWSTSLLNESAERTSI
jgi:hypothetical protein